VKKSEIWLKKTFDYEFAEHDYLAQALTHRSVPGVNNERLEFLGDAVLDAVVSEVVYRNFPFSSEGDLSRLRSSLVKDSSLADLASNLGVGEHLILGPGEKKTGGHRRASILADALEAIFGAVYLDAGYQAASQIIHKVFGDRFDNLPNPGDLRDPKTRLQEYLQAAKLSLPHYDIVEITGKAHDQHFVVRCSISEKEMTTTGEASSRRDAEQSAAEAMAVALGINSE
jgi:ribonuclease-3